MPNEDVLIMVVDDEPTICRILERVLTQEGYKVIVAGDGQAGLDMFGKHFPDLVLLDLMMPGINGREVGRRIRERSATTRIIYLSAKPVPADSPEEEEINSEADGFIPKPATSKEILSTIRSVLTAGSKKPEVHQ